MLLLVWLDDRVEAGGIWFSAKPSATSVRLRRLSVPEGARLKQRRAAVTTQSPGSSAYSRLLPPDLRGAAS